MSSWALPLRLLGWAAGAASTALVLHIAALRRSRRPPHPPMSETSARLLSLGQRRLLATILDGGVFGVDIGGSLAKILFFEPDEGLVSKLLRRPPPSSAHHTQWRAMLSSVRALGAFIHSATRYGATGVRDAHLSFHMAALGGAFHFIRFETRRMDGALRLAARHGLTAGMRTVCATGGGAIKVRGCGRGG